MTGCRGQARTHGHSDLPPFSWWFSLLCIHLLPGLSPRLGYKSILQGQTISVSPTPHMYCGCLVMLSEWMSHSFCLGIWNPETGWSREDPTPRQWAQQQAPTSLGWGGVGWGDGPPGPTPLASISVPWQHWDPCLLRVALLSALLNSITLDFVDLPQNRPVFADPCLDKLPHSSLCHTHLVQWSHRSQQQTTAVSIISTTKGTPLPTLWTQPL